jgi:hypothetical protein
VYQKDAEVLFPTRVIILLRHLRSDRWQQLVEHVIGQSESSPETLAFSLMMIRLTGCLTCHADSYRAMRGCTLCAQQSIARFKGSDADLVAAYEKAREDMQNWHGTGEIPLSERLPPEIQ